MNSFFDEYVKENTGLREFIKNFQKTLEKQYLREVEPDYKTVYTERRLIFGFSLERHAATIYTKICLDVFNVSFVGAHLMLFNGVMAQ